jgi:hypothetical protein
MEPIVPDEVSGMWLVWHDDQRYPSRNFARQMWRAQ